MDTDPAPPPYSVHDPNAAMLAASPLAAIARALNNHNQQQQPSSSPINIPSLHDNVYNDDEDSENFVADGFSPSMLQHPASSIPTPPMSPQGNSPVQKGRISIAAVDFDSAAAYFEARPVTIRRRADVTSHFISIFSHSKPSNFPYPGHSSAWTERKLSQEITVDDWSTFLNFIFPNHLVEHNTELLSRKLQAEATRRSTVDSSDSSSEDDIQMSRLSQEQLQFVVDGVQSEKKCHTFEHSNMKRRRITAVIREWNEEFFIPRGVKVDASIILSDDNMPPSPISPISESLSSSASTGYLHPERRLGHHHAHSHHHVHPHHSNQGHRRSESYQTPRDHETSYFTKRQNPDNTRRQGLEHRVSPSEGPWPRHRGGAGLENHRRHHSDVRVERNSIHTEISPSELYSGPTWSSHITQASLSDSYTQGLQHSGRSQVQPSWSNFGSVHRGNSSDSLSSVPSSSSDLTNDLSTAPSAHALGLMQLAAVESVIMRCITEVTAESASAYDNAMKLGQELMSELHKAKKTHKHAFKAGFMDWIAEDAQRAFKPYTRTRTQSGPSSPSREYSWSHWPGTNSGNDRADRRNNDDASISSQSSCNRKNLKELKDAIKAEKKAEKDARKLTKHEEKVSSKKKLKTSGTDNLSNGIRATSCSSDSILNGIVTPPSPDMGTSATALGFTMMTPAMEPTFITKPSDHIVPASSSTGLFGVEQRCSRYSSSQSEESGSKGKAADRGPPDSCSPQ
jgi:hypothetical protein